MSLNSPTNTFYVYIHKTMDTNEVFHVGKGKGNRDTSKKSRNPFWKNIVVKHGFYSERIMENLSETSAYIQEILAIKHYQPRTNFLPGGVGGTREVTLSNFERNPELRNKLSIGQKENYKNNPERAQNRGEESKSRWKDLEYRERVSKSISKALTGKPRLRTPEHQAKIAAANTGKRRGLESKQRTAIAKGSKFFQVFSISGDLLGEWISKRECARVLGLSGATSVTNYLEGRQKIAKA